MAPGLCLRASPVIRTLERDEGPGAPEVALEWRHGDPNGPERVNELLAQSELCIIQHEYGIFDGPDGAAIVEVIERSPIPTIVVLHTVLAEPTTMQRSILEEVCGSADAVVTQTNAARRRLLQCFSVSSAKTHVIQHGAAPNLTDRTRLPSSEPLVLTWGLIGPGKGLELAIDAMAEPSDLNPAPRYLVAGQTHPKVLALQGERYRESLHAHADSLGMSDRVTFDDRYRSLAELATLIRSADLVLLPYESRDQVTSGVLVEALASGQPVVATAFPHAREALASGAGRIVGHDDPRSMADAIRELITDPRQAAVARDVAARVGRTLFWPEIGRRYLELADVTIAGSLAARRPLLLASG